MDNILFELLTKKLIKQLESLNMGCVINEVLLAECWDLIHILHCGEYDSASNKDLYKILDYYE